MTAMISEGRGDVTTDRFLGGAVEVLQPRRRHHRAGLEAVLLGAALPADFAGVAVDLGAGAGAAGFCLAARAEAAKVVLVEREAELLDLARAALARPANRGFAARVTAIAADLGAGPPPVADADAVLTNPPFHDPAGATAPEGAARGRAHLLETGGLDRWFRAAAGILRPGGRLVGIFRADALEAVLRGFSGRFGGLEILPIQPRAGDPARRIVVGGVKGSRAAPTLLPGLALHGTEGNAFRPEVETILRDGAALTTIAPGWAHRHPRPEGGTDGAA